MLVRVGLTVIALCCAGVFAGEEAASGVPIAVVKTWADLAGQPTVELHKNATARFGIQALSGPCGSGVVIYCMTEAYDPGDDDDSDEDDKLGPFRMIIQKPSATDPPEQKQREIPPIPDRKRDYGRLVFAQAIFLSELGAHSVEIRDATDKVVASVKIDCVKGAFHAWSSLVSGEDPPEKPDEELAQNPRPILATATGEKGYPILSGNKPVLYAMASGARGPTKFADNDLLPTIPEPVEKPVATLTEAQRKQAENWIAELSSEEFARRAEASSGLLALGSPAGALLRAAERKTTDGETLLRLRKIIAGNHGPFHLELDGTELLLERNPVLPIPGEALEHRLLIRWWLNGKPVMPKDEQPADAIRLQLVSDAPRTRTIRMRLWIDAAGLGAKSGDTIACQMLWCPDGTQQSPETLSPADVKAETPENETTQDEEESFPPHLPILSNKIEFKVP